MSVLDLCGGPAFFEKNSFATAKPSFPQRPLENIVVSCCAKAHPILLIFSLFALAVSAIGGARAQSPLPQKTFKIFFVKKVKNSPQRRAYNTLTLWLEETLRRNENDTSNNKKLFEKVFRRGVRGEPVF